MNCRDRDNSEFTATRDMLRKKLGTRNFDVDRNTIKLTPRNIPRDPSTDSEVVVNPPWKPSLRHDIGSSGRKTLDARSSDRARTVAPWREATGSLDLRPDLPEVVPVQADMHRESFSSRAVNILDQVVEGTALSAAKGQGRDRKRATSQPTRDDGTEGEKRSKVVGRRGADSQHRVYDTDHTTVPRASRR